MANVQHSVLTGAELHKAKVDVGSGAPSGSPDFNGELALDIQPGSRTTLWGSSAGAWVAIAGTTRFGGSSPAGVFTPDYRGQFYYGTSTDTLYLAIGATSSDWVVIAVSTPATGGGGS